MIPINDEQIAEMATAVRRGKEVYVHREHGRVLIADDPERNLQADPEVFEIIMQTVSTDQESYLHIERLSAEAALNIMRAYVDRVRDQELWQALTYALKRPRPFQTFKGELKRYPKSYERWRNFRQKRYEAYVREKLETDTTTE
ncbi:MAG: UPF0158 family protein [Bacteroidota bacterium]